MSKPTPSGSAHRRYGCLAAVLTFALAVAYLVTFGFTLTPRTRDGLLRQYAAALSPGATLQQARDYLSSNGISEGGWNRPFYESFKARDQTGQFAMDMIGDFTVTERASVPERDIHRVIRVQYPTVTGIDLVTYYET